MPTPRREHRIRRRNDHLVNALLVAFLVVLGVVAAFKWRHELTAVSTEVKGIQVTRPTEPHLTSTTTTTTTTLGTDPLLVWALLSAANRPGVTTTRPSTRASRRGSRTTTTSTAAVTRPVATVIPPTTPTTTRTTRPTSTTTTTTSTSTTTTTTTTTEPPLTG
jgi:hypothetical protein